jgi:hypothetical protein
MSDLSSGTLLDVEECPPHDQNPLNVAPTYQ